MSRLVNEKGEPFVDDALEGFTPTDYYRGYKDGYEDAIAQIVRCKDCKHRIVNEHYGEKGYLKLEAICELDTGDPFELGRCAENDEWFCADGERREDGQFV